MIVTIMYRNNFEGGDGWTYHPTTVTIADHCPVCGEKRGTPYPHTFCEDGEWFTVDRWDNPCGHIDTYKNCWKEHLQGSVSLFLKKIHAYLIKG